jgi:hypothetical protein
MLRIGELGQGWADPVIKSLKEPLKALLKNAVKDIRPDLRDAMKEDVLPYVLLYVVSGLVVAGIASVLVCKYMDSRRKRRKR